MTPVLIDNDGTPVELGAGRGDLSFSSEAFAAWEGGSFLGNRPVSYAKMFATQAWVAIAVMRLLTWSIRVPLKVYRRLDSDGEKHRLRAGEHSLATAVGAPWPRGSMADLTMAMLGPMCVHGNSLIDVDEGARGALRFDELDWRQISPIRLNELDPNAEIEGWKHYVPGASPVPHSANTVMHFKWWSPLGKLGVSPLQQLRSTITAETAAVDWQVNSLKQGVRPHGVVEMAPEAVQLKRDDRQQIYDDAVEALRTTYSGEKNAGKLPVLPPGFKWTVAASTTAVEAELIDQRAVNRNEVSAVYMIPPPMIGILERSTFNNIYTLREMAYTDGLAPPLVLIEQIINAHLVRDLLREDDVFVEYDFAGILRGDRLKEIQALRQAIGSGLLTPNEGRDVLNLPQSPADQASKLWMPTNNLSPIDEPRPPKKGGGSATATNPGKETAHVAA